LSDEDPESDALRDYLIEYFEKSGKEKIEFNMSTLLGFGGESVVVKKKIKFKDTEKDCAIRTSKLNERPKIHEELGIVETDTYDRLNVREMAVEELYHTNIITYIDNTFEFIDDKFHHLTGKLTFKTFFLFRRSLFSIIFCRLTLDKGIMTLDA